MRGREATVDACVDHVHAQGLMAIGDLADLVCERRIPVRAVEEVHAILQLTAVERADPT